MISLLLTVNAPVEGLNDSLVEDVFCGRLPVVDVTQVGYTVALVVVSSVIAVFAALVAVVTAVELITATTWAAVAAVNAAVPLP